MASTDSNQPTSDAPAGAQPRGAARFFGRRPSLQTPTEALHPDTPPGPPVTPNSKRRPMLSTASGLLSFVLIAAVGGLGFLAYASSRLAEPGPLAADKVVIIPPRTEVSDIVDQLEKAGVVRQAFVMKAALVIDQKWSQVKAGEYMFKQHASLNEVIDTLVSGKAILHSVTIPEGLTSEQIVERLRQNELLVGDILDIPGEGTLLPETYRVLRGQSRASVIRQMRDYQTRELDRIWERRSADIPVRSKIELLTLASIVEKETGRADERTRVAAVFYNRLRRGMKLQSDPTIVYGIVGGKGTLGRPIQRDEILRPSPLQHLRQSMACRRDRSPIQARHALEAVSEPLEGQGRSVLRRRWHGRPCRSPRRSSSITATSRAGAKSSASAAQRGHSSRRQAKRIRTIA